MCWSGAASASLAVAGVAGTVYFYKKGEDRALWLSLLFFTLIEFIQTYTYTVIDQCLNPANTMATTLAYIHVSLQPFFFNAIALYFLPAQVRRKIRFYVYGLCAIASMAMITRILPLEWKSYCYEVRYYVPFMKNLMYHVPFCGDVTCSTSGSWHMEWAIRAGFNWYLDRAYFVSVFILPLLYGSWKATLYAIIMGPVITLLSTNGSNEFAAVWCLYSVAILLLLFKLPIRKYLHVHSYYGFRAGIFSKA